MKFRQWIAGLAVAVGMGVGSAHSAIVDLGFALDRSGSVGSTNWSTVVNGLANALAVIPTVGPNQYRVAVSSFASTAVLNLAPTIVTADNLITLQNTIRGIGYTGGGTNISTATTALTNGYIAAGGFGDVSLLNVSTDGVSSGPAAATLRQTLVDAGWDSISAEAVGSFNLTYLQTLVFPNPGVTTNDPSALPNPLVQGFVLTVNNFDAYEAAITAKVQRIVDTQVPTPGTLSLVALSLLGLGLMTRRRLPA